jgi:hypothetical protein
MTPTTTFKALQARVAIEIRDGGQTFLTTEVAEALTRAIEDDVVYSIIEAQIPLTGARTYALSPFYTTIYSMGADNVGQGWPTFDISGDQYDLVNNNLILDGSLMNLTGTLYVQVAQKWQVTDDIPEYLSNYIINSTIFYLGELLENTYESRFLNNDVTMAELLNRSTEAGNERTRLRKQLRNQKLVRL